jgi:hypothetical protein
LSGRATSLRHYLDDSGTGARSSPPAIACCRTAGIPTAVARSSPFDMARAPPSSDTPPPVPLIPMIELAPAPAPRHPSRQSYRSMK